MEIVIDLEKGRLNTARLVKRPVQVRGKDGKVHTRMQWVDPRADQPKVRTKAQEDNSHHGILGNQKFTNPYDKVNTTGYNKDTKLSASDFTPEGKQIVDDWSDKYKDHPELLYDMLNHLGVLKDPTDPRKNKDDKTAPIKHMHNMMRMKKLIKEDMDTMGKMDDMFPIPDAPPAKPSTATAKKKDKPKSKAEEGGNTIKGILDKMSREEKYELMGRLGIANIDPANVPEWGKDGDKTAPIKNMHNMMKLKKAIELDPSILNLDVSGEPNETEKKRLEGRDKSEKARDVVKEFLDQASRELKLEWASQFEDHEYMKNRVKSEHSHISNMHTISALKKIIEEDPSLMEGDMKTQLDKELLRNIKITNKQMQKILIHAVGLKGIGDVVQEEKGVEWSFGEGSFARIDEDDDGNPVLSVVDTGKDGEGWDESQFPMEKIKEFLDGLKDGSQAKKVKARDIPLAERIPKDIWNALTEDLDKNYSTSLDPVLKPLIGEAWITSGRKGRTHLMAKMLGTETATLEGTLKAMGIKVDEFATEKFDFESDSWKELAYTHLIKKSKEGNANELIQRWKDPTTGADKVDTWVLHESAKNWDSQERMQARSEIIDAHLKVDKGRYPKGSVMSDEDRRVKIIDHANQSLEFVPFDLMTDVIINGCNINIKELGPDGKENSGAFYLPSSKEIWLDIGYMDDAKSLSASNPMDHRPKGIRRGTSTIHLHPFSDTMSHEFAHAVDHFLGDHKAFIKWTNKKYSGSDPQAVLTSYNKTVERSNPNKYLGHAENGGIEYVWHKDEWMSTYEGRVYDQDYTNMNMNGNLLEVGSNGEVIDKGWGTRDNMRGLEHWSENSSRYSNGFQMYKKWKNETGDTSTSMKDWAKDMHEKFMSSGYGDDSNAGDTFEGPNGKVVLKSYKYNLNQGRNENPMEAYGYLLHKMGSVHPELSQTMDEVYGRGDFVSDKDTPNRRDLFESGDYTRKSTKLELIIEL